MLFQVQLGLDLVVVTSFYKYFWPLQVLLFYLLLEAGYLDHVLREHKKVKHIECSSKGKIFRNGQYKWIIFEFFPLPILRLLRYSQTT